ncbi:MAG: hypothetical protein Ta2F_11460 [Termitinemataceae bacterium]|nr:MAG: hypothetical protein Ta2F_11460 [Termitinemataceae bacterium]
MSKKNIFISLAIGLCYSFQACAAEKVLDLSKKSAEIRLSKKQLVFVIDAESSRVGEIAKIDPSAPFYTALLLQDILPDDEKINLLLESAVRSPIVHKYAVEKLFPKDPDKYFELASRYPDLAADTVWGDAFNLIQKISGKHAKAESKNHREELRKEILDFFLLVTVDSARKWALSKLKDQQLPVSSLNLLNTGQIAAIEGHLAVSRRSYGDAFKHFKLTLEDNKEIFLQYNELLGDLGKAYQYNYPKEGAALFEEWEKRDKLNNEARYLLLYYAGRMMRQSKNYAAAEPFFDKAAGLTPDDLQKDACYWYIIDGAWAQSAVKAVNALKKYAPLWSDPLYFADIFEKISLYYTQAKRWDALPQFFPAVLQHADDESLAKYAYIIGRAYSFGYITPEDAVAALKDSKDWRKKTDLETLGDASNSTIDARHQGDIPKPEDFYRIAYNCKDYRGTAFTPFYYHSLAAQHLFERSNFKLPPKNAQSSVVPVVKNNKNVTSVNETLVFLENFFRFGCADKVYPYLKAESKGLSIEELRYFAEKLEASERWGDAIRLSLGYMGRADYVLDRRDLEICYPKAFKDVVEPIAEKTGMEPSLLYALIRTESIFIPDIVSHAGAIGLTQLMPATGTEMARTLNRETGIDYTVNGALDFTDPNLNVNLGASYYMQLYQRTGSRLLALLSYNGGIGRVNRWRKTTRDLSEDLFLETVTLTETREYGKKVLAAEAVYDFLY